ncbi:hypothetical protein [Clostridium sp. Cult1]|uniref:hypothetical protein n=1 Tax=Clostridium sp. Cult1 TaxID=2079002 RepID=UPI001F34BCCB|nr:hypothetical protein [Clostridium sp. Cult1]MCF6463747.1 hypothetical protein [Clostridium sp. Cult1]
MKKKRGKYILLAIVGIIVILIAINWGNIKLLINFMSKNTQDDTQIVEDELAELENPLLDIIDKEDSGSEPINKYNGEKKDDPSSENTGDENTTVEKNEDELFLEIAAKYNTEFEALRTEFEGQLDIMVKEGYDEYKNGNISKIKLANKYMYMSKELEKESDAKFNQVLKEMEQELKDNGLDTNITKEVSSYYKNYKEKKKMDILAKGSKVK